MTTPRRNDKSQFIGIIVLVLVFLTFLGRQPPNVPIKAGASSSQTSALAAMPLLSSQRIRDRASFHRRSFADPLAASTQVQFRRATAGEPTAPQP